MTKQVLEDFISYWRNNQDVVKIYNEFSFQFELGIYLRSKGYKVEFEKNVEDVIKNYKNTVISKKINEAKKEIDLVIYNNNEEKFAIELKYPRNGAYPETFKMFKKDKEFIDELCNSKYWAGEEFKDGWSFILADNKNYFYLTGKEDPKGPNYGLYTTYREKKNSTNRKWKDTNIIADKGYKKNNRDTINYLIQ